MTQNVDGLHQRAGSRRAARERGRPVALVNLGRTRADADCCLKLERDCASLLPAVAAAAEKPRIQLLLDCRHC